MTKKIEPEDQVVIRGSSVVFPNFGDYEIELSRIDTPEKLLAWLIHMSEKTWFTSDIARWFILKVSRHQKMKIPQGL
jgi:hypothetical protein